MNKFKDQCECCGKYKKCSGVDGKLLCDDCKAIYIHSNIKDNEKIIIDKFSRSKYEQPSIFGIGGLLNE